MTFDDLKLALDDLARLPDGAAAAKTTSRDTSLKRSRCALTPLRLALWLEAAQAVALIALLGWFVATHSGSSWPPLVSAGLLMTLEFVYLVATIRQQILLHRVDCAEPVADVQYRLGELMALRSRTVWGVLIAAPLVWLPLLIVAAEWFVGVDVVAVTSGAWVAANLGLGLAVLSIGSWIAIHPPRWVERSMRLRRLFDYLSGRSLNRALDHAAEAAAFERDTE